MVNNSDMVVITLTLIDIIEEMQEYSNCKISTNQKLQNLKSFIIQENCVIETHGEYIVLRK